MNAGGIQERIDAEHLVYSVLNKRTGVCCVLCFCWCVVETLHSALQLAAFAPSSLCTAIEFSPDTHCYFTVAPRIELTVFPEDIRS